MFCHAAEQTHSMTDFGRSCKDVLDNGMNKYYVSYTIHCIPDLEQNQVSFAWKTWKKQCKHVGEV